MTCRTSEGPPPQAIQAPPFARSGGSTNESASSSCRRAAVRARVSALTIARQDIPVDPQQRRIVEYRRLNERDAHRMRRVEVADSIDNVQARSDRSLGVVLDGLFSRRAFADAPGG